MKFIIPMIVPEIYSYLIEGKRVLVIQVYPGSSTPYYLKRRGKIDGNYIRVGRTNKQADEEMVKELERRRINKSYDEDVYKEVDYQVIELQLKLMRGVLASDISEEKLLNLKLIEVESGKYYLTNAGAILLGYMENASVKCAKFLGNFVLNFVDKKSSMVIYFK